MKGTGGENIDQRCFAGILQPYQRQLHLFLEEQTAVNKHELKQVQEQTLNKQAILVSIAPAQPIHEPLPHTSHPCCSWEEAVSGGTTQYQQA